MSEDKIKDRKFMSYADEIKLLNAASHSIDSTWHYSWHWEKKHGSLSIDGWNTALKDGVELLSELKRQVRELERIIPEIKRAIEDKEIRRSHE